MHQIEGRIGVQACVFDLLSEILVAGHFPLVCFVDAFFCRAVSSSIITFRRDVDQMIMSGLSVEGVMVGGNTSGFTVIN